MTVKELRDALSRFPEDLPVCFADCFERYANPREVGAVYYNAGNTCYEPAGHRFDEFFEAHLILDIRES